jgi:hypothetical protein
VSGYECGLHIINSAWVRLRNVGVKAAVHTGGDSNAAMVREREQAFSHVPSAEDPPLPSQAPDAIENGGIALPLVTISAVLFSVGLNWSTGR